MTFFQYIKQLLEKRLGCAINRPADCEILANDIESITNDHVGVNTVKRLLGFKADEREPRLTTLDILPVIWDVKTGKNSKIWIQKAILTLATCQTL